MRNRSVRASLISSVSVVRRRRGKPSRTARRLANSRGLTQVRKEVKLDIGKELPNMAGPARRGSRLIRHGSALFGSARKREPSVGNLALRQLAPAVDGQPSRSACSTRKCRPRGEKQTRRKIINYWAINGNIKTWMKHCKYWPDQFDFLFFG